MAEFKELLKIRRSVRDYQDREVPLELILEILKEATLAPSASNEQPWHFIIVRDRELMKRISDESKKNLLAEIQAAPDNHPSKRYEGILKMPQFNVFYNAPSLIILCGPRGHRTLRQDLALCASYIMFGAADRGLGTCWVDLGGVIKDPGLRQELGLPEDFEVVAPIIMGWPKTVPTASPRKEPAILKIIPTE